MELKNPEPVTLVDVVKFIEKKYKDLSSPYGSLTPEGRGYLIGMGDVIRYINGEIKE